MNLETLDLWAQQALSALFNGGYQGLLLTLAVALALRWAPRANAATRHAVWFVTLLLVALLPLLHGLRDVRFGSLFPRTVAESQHTPLPMEILEPSNIGPAVPSLELSPVPLLIPGHERQGPLLDSKLSSVTEENVTSEVPKRVGARSDPHEAITPAVLVGRLPWRFSLPTGWAVVLVATWLGIAGVRLLALTWQLWRLRSLKRCATPAPAEWQHLFVQAAEEMRLKRCTRLVLAADVSTPMVIGLGRPTVVLPATGFEQVSKDQLRQVLRHELGHVVRGDDWMNLIQQVIRAVLFFHPAVGWVSRRLTLEREVACDDHVLAAPVSPKAYALLLTEFAGRMPGRDFAAAPAAWNHQTQLKERIHMILDSRRNASPRLVGVRLAILAAASLALAGLALQAAPRVSLATDPTSRAEVAVVTDVSVEGATVADPNAIAATPAATSAEPTVLVVDDNGNFARMDAKTARRYGLTEALPVPASSPKPVEVPSGTPLPSSNNAGNFYGMDPLLARRYGLTSEEVLVPTPPPTPAQGVPLEQRLDRLEGLVNQLVGQISESKDLFGGASKQKQAEISADVERTTRDALNKDELARYRMVADPNAIAATPAARSAESTVVVVDDNGNFALIDAKTARRIGLTEVLPGRELERVAAQRRAIESRRKALEAQMDALEEEMESLEKTQELLQNKASEAAHRSEAPGRQEVLEDPADQKAPAKPLKQ